MFRKDAEGDGKGEEGGGSWRGELIFFWGGIHNSCRPFQSPIQKHEQ